MIMDFNKQEGDKIEFIDIRRDDLNITAVNFKCPGRDDVEGAKITLKNGEDWSVMLYDVDVNELEFNFLG